MYHTCHSIDVHIVGLESMHAYACYPLDDVWVRRLTLKRATNFGGACFVLYFEQLYCRLDPFYLHFLSSHHIFPRHLSTQSTSKWQHSPISPVHPDRHSPFYPKFNHSSDHPSHQPQYYVQHSVHQHGTSQFPVSHLY